MRYLLYFRDFAVCFAAVFSYGKIMSVPVKPLIPASLAGAAFLSGLPDYLS